MARSEPAQKPRLDQLSEADQRRMIEAAQQDRARFADLYDEYFVLVYAYVARRARDRAATEDLTSEVFRKALTNLPRFKWTGAPFAAWLFRIASNVIADRAKRMAREGKATQVDNRGDSPTVREGVDAPLLTRGLLPRGASDRPQQQADLEAAERRVRLFRLVDELSDDQRRVVLMRFADEKSIREIAGELDRSAGAVKQLQFRALENLRKRFTTEETKR